MSKDSLTDERLDEIAARAAAATAGPWVAMTSGRAGGDHWYVCDDGESIASIHANDGSDEQQRQPDAEFIAHARGDVPALVAEVRRLRADYDTVRAQRSTALKSVEELQRRIDDMESDRASWENEVIDALNIEDDDDIAQSEIILRHIKSLAVASPSTAQEARRDAVRAVVVESLRDVAYVCTRVWEAWGYGTMTEDDFAPAWEDDELIESLVNDLIPFTPASALEAVKADTTTEWGEGWYEWLVPGLSLTRVAYVYESGRVYFPEGDDVDQSDFLLASAQGNAWRLVRVATEGESRG